MAAKKKPAKKTTAAKKNMKSLPAPKKKAVEVKKLNPQIKALIFCAVAVILGAFIIIKGENIWSAIRGFIFGLFGIGSILLPVMFIYLAIITAKEKQIAHSKIKGTLIAFIILFADAAVYLFSMNK